MEMDNDVSFPRAKTKNGPGNQNVTRRVSIAQGFQKCNKKQQTMMCRVSRG
jgi:hypothetical protein